MLRRRLRSALYIDWANINPQFPSGTFVDSLPGWLPWLEDGKFDPTGRRRSFVEMRAYINGNYLRHVPALEAAGFEVIPSSDDMLIALDMADSAAGDNGIREYILFTVDEEFVHLLERLGERGKLRAVTVAEGQASAKAFPPRSEIIIPLDRLRSAFPYRRSTFFGKFEHQLRSKLPPWLRVTGRRALPPLTKPPTDQWLVTVADHVATLALSKQGARVGRNSVLTYLRRNMTRFNRKLPFGGSASA